MTTMPTITIAHLSLRTVEAELNSAVSVVQPRLARGSNMHPITEYAAKYDADRAELAAEMAANPYTARYTR
jgi:hypothetical protein